MSDCSKQAWHVPAEREPGVIYVQGHPNVDYSAATAVVVDGQRFERVTRCQDCRHEFNGTCMLPDGHGDYRREYVDPDCY